MSGELKQQEQAANISRLYMLVIGGTFIVAAIGQLANLPNSWALFMLVPVGFFLAHIWSNYQQTGELSSTAFGAIVAVVATVGLIAIFMFNLSWGLLAPIGLLGVGVAFVATRL